MEAADAARSWRVRPAGRRQFRVSHRVTFTVLGLGLLLGYGTMWLNVRGQRFPHGPDLATFAVVTLLGVGSVMSGVHEARADSGVGGLSAIRRRASFLSVLIGLAAMFALGGALAHAGASQAVISVFEASAPVMVAVYYLSTNSMRKLAKASLTAAGRAGGLTRALTVAGRLDGSGGFPGRRFSSIHPTHRNDRGGG